MSVFDQFNANPYIKMYAGAPIDEALEVGKIMQGRHDKALTDMQQHEYALSNIKGIGAADKAYKNKYAAELSAEFEKLAEAPEMAGQAINSLAAKYKQDPTLRAMATNAAAMKEWEDAYAKDPSKYGDVANYEMQQAVQQYNADGGAASAAFKAPPLKELKDINEFVRENAALIKSSSNGEIAFDKARGLIHTQTGESVSFEHAQTVLNAALMGDPAMREQLQRQFKYEKGRLGYEGDFTNFVGQSTQGVAAAVSFTKNKVDAKGWNPYPKKGKNASGSAAYLYGAGANTVVDKGSISTMKDLSAERNARNPSNYQDTQLSRAEDREFQGSIDAWAADNQTKTHAANFFRQAGIDGLPSKTDMSSAGSKFSNSAGGVGFNANSASGKSDWDMAAVTQYAANNELNEAQTAQLVKDVMYGMNGVFGDNLTDNMNELRKSAYQTTWTPIESYNLDSNTEGALNRVVFTDLTSAGSLVATINGEQVEMSQGDFNRLYEGAKVTTFETEGSGQVEVKAKKRGSNEYDTVSYVMPVGTSSARKFIGAKEVEMANESTGRTRSMHLKNALAIGAPTLVAQGHAFDNGATYNGDAIGLDFGDAQALIVNDFGGNPELKKDDNGDFVFTINGKNLFDNNEKMTNLLSRNGLTGAEAVAEINDYITRQYAQGGS